MCVSERERTVCIISNDIICDFGSEFCQNFVCDTNGVCNFCACWFKIKVKLCIVYRRLTFNSSHFNTLAIKDWSCCHSKTVERKYFLHATNVTGFPYQFVSVGATISDVLHSTWCNSAFCCPRWKDKTHRYVRHLTSAIYQTPTDRCILPYVIAAAFNWLVTIRLFIFQAE